MIIARLSRLGWLGLIAAVFVSTGVHAGERAATLSGVDLIRALRGGGYTIYFRHAATDWSQHDRVRAAGDWLSCDPARMRQLSAQGRDTATALGADIRSLQVPVDQVLASPYCRTVETARLMELGEVDTTTDVMNMRVAEYFQGHDAIARRARRRLAMPPAPDSNTVVVAHGNVALSATGVHLSEGEAAVFQPLGNEDFNIIGRLTPAEWQRVRQALDEVAPSPP